MSPEFESLYHRHALTSYEKQLRLADMIGTLSWRCSMKDGSLTFDEEGDALHATDPIVFAAQLLGTVAYDDSTWLWSWANEASQIPSALTRDAQRMRDAGLAAEWTTPRFTLNLDNADEHRLAMASSGLFAADAFYRGPYAGGAAFFLLRQSIAAARTGRAANCPHDYRSDLQWCCCEPSHRDHSLFDRARAAATRRWRDGNPSDDIRPQAAPRV